MRQTSVSRFDDGHTHSVNGDKSTCQLARTGYRYLLSEDGPHREFEAIPTAWRAETRSTCHQWRQERIG
jgi:hypothetical protein